MVEKQSNHSHSKPHRGSWIMPILSACRGANLTHHCTVIKYKIQNKDPPKMTKEGINNLACFESLDHLSSWCRSLFTYLISIHNAWRRAQTNSWEKTIEHSVTVDTHPCVLEHRQNSEWWNVTIQMCFYVHAYHLCYSEHYLQHNVSICVYVCVFNKHVLI